MADTIASDVDPSSSRASWSMPDARGAYNGAHILQIDVEDWFTELPADQWPSYPDRAADHTRRLLRILDEHEAKATFFVLGYVAERQPELVREIRNAGHEIGCHGFGHRHFTKIDAARLADDLDRAIAAIRRASPGPVQGHRAPQFSVLQRTRWALPVIAQRFAFDSSIFPCRTNPYYGVPSAPQRPYRPSFEDITQHDPNGILWEVPLTALAIPVIGPLPALGGFHLRAFPLSFHRAAIAQRQRSGLPAVLYLHPHELDATLSVIPGYPWHQYHGRRHAERRLRALLSEYRWGATTTVLWGSSE